MSSILAEPYQVIPMLYFLTPRLTTKDLH